MYRQLLLHVLKIKISSLFRVETGSMYAGGEIPSTERATRGKEWEKVKMK